MEKKVLIFKNAKEEGPGTILGFLEQNKIGYSVIEAYSHDFDDEIILPYEYLIVLGGPMGVYEMETYPHLKRVASVMERALKEKKRILGICLGCQLLAHVLGSRVYRADKEEIGWSEIQVTYEGLMDPCFAEFTGGRKRIEVFQWHMDTFVLPSGALRLAKSDHFENQAFLYDESYGLQFHPEINPSMVKAWANGRTDITFILDKTRSLYPRYKETTFRFLKAFFSKKN